MCLDPPASDIWRRISRYFLQQDQTTNSEYYPASLLRRHSVRLRYDTQFFVLALFLYALALLVWIGENIYDHVG
jgi:hypothetical protein